MQIVADGHRRDRYLLTILIGTGVRGGNHGMARGWTIGNGPGRHVNVVTALARSVDAGHALTIVRVGTMFSGGCWILSAQEKRDSHHHVR